MKRKASARSKESTYERWLFLDAQPIESDQFGQIARVSLRRQSVDVVGGLSIAPKLISEFMVEQGRTLRVLLHVEHDDTVNDILLVGIPDTGLHVLKQFVEVVESIFPRETVVGLSQDELANLMAQHVQIMGPPKPAGGFWPISFEREPQWDLSKVWEILSKNPNWKTLSREQLMHGESIVSQDSTAERSWSCGPNSAARALKMLGYPIPSTDYQHTFFVQPVHYLMNWRGILLN